MKIIATNIDTEIWNNIISSLKSKRWIVTGRYIGFDAGIDNDYCILRKGLETVECRWTNWFEGEVKGEKALLAELEVELKVQFEYGNPEAFPNVEITENILLSYPLILIHKLKTLFKK